MRQRILKRSISMFAVLLFTAIITSANNSLLLQKLDSMLEASEAIVAEKNKRIEMLKQMAAKETNRGLLLERYRELSEEYYVFQFDSAKKYVEKGLALAKKVNNKRYVASNTIMKTKLLAIGGLYSEAIHTLRAIHPDSLEKDLLFDYNIEKFTIYSYWDDY